MAFNFGGLLAGIFGQFLEGWLPGALKLNPSSAAKTETVLGLPTGGAQAIVNGAAEAALTGVVAAIQHLSVHPAVVAVAAVAPTSRSVTLTETEPPPVDPVPVEEGPAVNMTSF